MSLERLKNLDGRQGRLLVCLEVNPPRGTSLERIFQRLDGKLDPIDFLNVTDSALARMKLAPIPFAAILKERYGKEPLVNLSCRDRNLIAMQGDLLAGWVTGIRSIVALTGDAVAIGDSPERKGVFEVNSIGLLSTIGALNAGRDISGNALEGRTDYVPGAVVNPNARNSGVELKRLAKKRDAGARYALSQPVFEEESAARFFEEAKGIGVPIFLGLLPFKTAGSAEAIGKIPGIKLSGMIASELSSGKRSDFSELSMELALRIAKRCSEQVCGFHVISGAAPGLALALARELAAYIKEKR